MVVDDRPGDPGGAGDGLDRHALVALLDDHARAPRPSAARGAAAGGIRGAYRRRGFGAASEGGMAAFQWRARLSRAPVIYTGVGSSAVDMSRYVRGDAAGVRRSQRRAHPAGSRADSPSGRPEGHLDLPRMRRGRVAGSDLCGVHAISERALGAGPARRRGDRIRARRTGSPTAMRRPSRPQPPAGCWRSSAPGRCGSRARAAIWMPLATTSAHRQPSSTSRGPRRSTPTWRRSSSGTPPGCARSVRCGAAPTGSATACRSSHPPRPTPGPA